MWVWPAACVWVSMRITTYVCAYAYAYMRVWVYVLQCNTVGGILACASYARVSSRARCTEKAKVLGGMGSHASIFLNSQDPPEYSTPICSSIQTDVCGGIARKTHRTIIYWEYNIGWKSNELLLEGCLEYACSFRRMKEKYCVYMIYTSVYFLHSQDACSGSEAPLIPRESRYTVRAIFPFIFSSPPATSSSFQEWNINWAWLHLSELLYVSC